MEKYEQLEKAKKRIVETSLGISRIDKKTKFEFTQLADSEFCSDYGMTLREILKQYMEYQKLKQLVLASDGKIEIRIKTFKEEKNGKDM